jgi:hypothetical protein
VQLDPERDSVIVVQDRHIAEIMKVPGVVRVATGLDRASGKAAIKVHTEKMLPPGSAGGPTLDLKATAVAGRSARWSPRATRSTSSRTATCSRATSSRGGANLWSQEINLAARRQLAETLGPLPARR